MEDVIIIDEMHHIGLLSLYEYSKPVSPRRHCENQRFLYVETEESIVTWLIGTIASTFYSPLSVTVACPDISESEYISQKTNKRKYHAVASENESRFLFSVIKVKKSKAIIKFLDGTPLEDSFRLPHSNKEITILKRGKNNKVLIQSDDLPDLKISEEYEAIAF